MNVYQSKIRRLAGSNYKEIYRVAHFIYKSIASKTRRKPYIRSKYFKHNKIFLDYFWSHLHEKNMKDRTRRLKQYACALDLIKNSTTLPIHERNTTNSARKRYRFIGLNENGETFVVQIMEEIKSGEKHLISCFPKS